MNPPFFTLVEDPSAPEAERFQILDPKGAGVLSSSDRRPLARLLPLLEGVLDMGVGLGARAKIESVMAVPMAGAGNPGAGGAPGGSPVAPGVGAGDATGNGAFAKFMQKVKQTMGSGAMFESAPAPDPAPFPGLTPFPNLAPDPVRYELEHIWQCDCPRCTHLRDIARELVRGELVELARKGGGN